MSEAEIYSVLTDLFRDLFADDNIVLSPHTVADDIEGWDSTNNINLIVATEARFEIRMLTSEIDDLKNVGDLVRLIGAKLERR